MKNIPFVPGMYPGIGCNPLTGRLFDSPFNKLDLYSPEGATGQTVEFSLQTVTSTQDLVKKLNFGTSVSIVSGGPFSTVSAAAKLLHKRKFTAQNLYLLVSTIVTHSYETLITFPLKPEILSLIEEKSLDRFRASYGNGFIAGFIKGGYYYGLIEIQTSGLDEKRKLAGKLNAQAFVAGSAQLNAGRYLNEAIADRRTQISIFRSGGSSVSAGLTLEEMLKEASTFPSSVAKNPAIPFAIYRDYDDIPPFSQLGYSQRREYQEFIQCIDHLESLYFEYRDDYETLKSLLASPNDINNFLIEETAIVDLQSTIEADIAGLSGQMDTLKSLVNRCNETTSPCAIPEELYQISPDIRSAIETWKEVSQELGSVSEKPKQMGSQSQLAENNDMNINRACYNTAVVGITGVGKSSLVNYLFGKNVAETGLGRPVTRRGFKSYEFKIRELPIKLFDSWGLEVNRINEWMASLDEELSLRGTDRPADDWFHTILFCVNAAGSRIQDAEIMIIKRFLESKYQVVVILTKADTLNEEEEADFVEKIKEHTRSDLSVIPVCSESRKGRRGVTIEAFGKEEIEAQIYNNFWDAIIERLPQRCRRVVEEYLDNWESSQIQSIQTQADNGDSVESIQEKLSNSWSHQAIEDLIQEEISRTMRVYGQIVELMEYSPVKQKLDIRNRLKEHSSQTTEVPTHIAVAASIINVINIGMAATALAPLTISFPIGLAIAVPVIILGNKKQRREAIASLMETVRTHAKNFRAGLDDLEKSIETGLKNLRSMDSQSIQ